MRIKTAQPITSVARELVAVMIAEDLTMLRDVRERDDWNAFGGQAAQGASAGLFSKVVLANTGNFPTKLGVLDKITVNTTVNYAIALEPVLGGAQLTFSLDPRIGYQVGTPFLTDVATPAAVPLAFAVVPAALATIEFPNGIIIPPGFMVSVTNTVVNLGITVSFFFRQLALPGN